jgi:hypothetical protein
MRGNLIDKVKIIILPGLSVGGTERIILKQANEKAPRMIPAMIIAKLRLFHNEKINIPRNNGGNEKIIPNMKEPQTSPKRIVLIDIGHVIKRSKVFWRVSQGKTTGPIDAAVKNNTIAMRPDVK